MGWRQVSGVFAAGQPAAPEEQQKPHHTTHKKAQLTQKTKKKIEKKIKIKGTEKTAAVMS